METVNGKARTGGQPFARIFRVEMCGDCLFTCQGRETEPWRPPSTVRDCQFHADTMPVYGPPTLTWYGTLIILLLVHVRSRTLAHIPLLFQGVRNVAVTEQSGMVPGAAVARGAAGRLVTDGVLAGVVTAGVLAEVGSVDGAGVGRGGGGEGELGTGGGGEGDVGTAVGTGGCVVGSWTKPWDD